MHGRTPQLGLPWQGTGAAAAQSSYDAARLAERTAKTDCAVLRRFYQTRGRQGATDAETEQALGWPANIVTARRNDLIDAGDVVTRWPVPRRASVKTPKLKVTVWVLVEFAR